MRIFINFVFALVVLSVPVFVLRAPGDTWLNASDFPAYYAAAKLMSRGHAADVYRMDKLQAEIHRYWKMPPKREAFVAEPPFFMPAFEPLANFTPAGAALFSFILAVVATSAAIMVLADTLELSNRGTIILIGLTAASGPLWENMHCGKPMPFMLLGLCCALSLLKRHRSGAAALATAMGLMKWHEILPFLSFAAGARKLSYLCWFVLASMALLIMSFGVFGLDGWSNYMHLLSDMSKTPELIGYGAMPILRGQLCSLQVPWPLVNVISIAAYGASLVFLCLFAGKFRDKNQWWATGFACSSLMSVTFGMHCHQYDLLLLIPAVCILLKKSAAIGDRIMFGLVSGLIFLYMLPMYVGLQYGLFGWLSSQGGTPNLFFIMLLTTTIYSLVFVYKTRDAQPTVPTGPNPVDDLIIPGISNLTSDKREAIKRSDR